MKQILRKSDERLWLQQVLAAALMFCFVCPLLEIPSFTAFGQPDVLAAVDLKTSKSPKEIEYEVKAAFIYNFMKFVEWPTEKAPSQNSDSNPQKRMTIGILGDNPFGDAFAPILDKEVQSHKIQLILIPSYQQFVERSADEQDASAAYQAKYKEMIQSCNVLFICDSEKDFITTVLRMGTGSHILTVSDVPGFAKKDGIIGFVKDNNKIRFEINLDTAQKEDIKIRSQLLALAKEVYGSK